MISMTGFGYCERSAGTRHYALDLKSYNNRYLDIYVTLPPALASLEPRVRQYIAGRVERGRVELSIRLKTADGETQIALDEGVARAYAMQLRRLAEIAGVEEKPHLAHFLHLEGVFRTVDGPKADELFAELAPGLDEVFRRFDETRRTEGDATRRDIEMLLDLAETRILLVESRVPVMEEAVKSNVRNRFREVLGDLVEENRILAEIAVLLMKYAFSEEIVRFKAHLAAFRATLSAKEIDGGVNTAGGSAVGKKLDFLCQEMNREINTIGSKSMVLEVNQAVVDVKDALEKIREQLRNVE